MMKDGLENLTFTGHTKGKGNRGCQPTNHLPDELLDDGKGGGNFSKVRKTANERNK